MNKERYVENHYVETWLEQGIVMVSYKSHLNKITIEIAKQNVTDRLYTTNGISRPCLIMTNNAVTMDKESRDYLSKADGIKHLSAGAILIDNRLSKLVGNIFLSKYMPIKVSEIPTKLFLINEKDEAIAWLSNFLIERQN
jgi:hypothetical protein